MKGKPMGPLGAGAMVAATGIASLALAWLSLGSFASPAGDMEAAGLGSPLSALLAIGLIAILALRHERIHPEAGEDLVSARS